jgi:hypothetical protein
MKKVRPPSLETNNQQLLIEQNARIVYSRLQSGKINIAAVLT